MDREIKLPRVWDVPQKEMLYPKWKTDYIGGKLMSLYIYETGDKRGHSSLSWVLHHPEFKVMWPTGPKDQYGADIYESSIITFLPDDGSTKIPQQAVVEYCEKRACFIAASKAWSIPLFQCLQIEIIGNIHQDSYLLE